MKKANLVDQPINSPLEHDLDRDRASVVAFDRQVDRPVDRGLIDSLVIENGDQPINLGDLVIARATATWFRHKSDKLTYREVQKKSFVSINTLSEPLFFELIEPSKVLEIKSDRVRVRHQKTGRTSVFYLKDVSVLEKAHHD